MKVPSKLIHAMVITAALAATTTSCQTMKPQAGDNEEYRILPESGGGVIGKIRKVFRPACTPSDCPLCGMG